MAQTSHFLRGFQLPFDRAVEGMWLANGGRLYVADPQGLSGDLDYEWNENAEHALPSPRSFYFVLDTAALATLRCELGILDGYGTFGVSDVRTLGRSFKFRSSIFEFRCSDFQTFGRSDFQTLRSHEERMRAIELNDVEAVVSADFVLHAVHVVLDGLLGKREVVGDFFVGEALSEQRDELLFAAREAETLTRAAAGNCGRFLLEVAEQRDA
jgi:hypothetical protein